MRTRLLWLALLCACSSNDDTIEEQRGFVDAAGRTCQATLEKTSPSSPVSSETVTCDGGARGCSTGALPCFQLSVEALTFQIRNCPACCLGTASSYMSEDCSALSCDTDADCVYARARCSEGTCYCPDGDCD
jgi:hypothetical protein